MMFFYKPKGHPEPKDKSLKRQSEAKRYFLAISAIPIGGLHTFYRPAQFRNSAYLWISKNFSCAIDAFYQVRAKLLGLYEEIDATFPDGLSKLQYQQKPTDVIRMRHSPVVQRWIYIILSGIYILKEEGYDEDNSKLEPFKVSERDANRLKMGEQTSAPDSGTRHGLFEEVREGNGKRQRGK